MDHIIIKGRIEKKNLILEHPELYTDTPMISFIFPREYMLGLAAYIKENGLNDYELTLAPWPIDPTIRARKFFFAMRDRLAEKTEGEGATRDYKDHLYRSCVRELDIRRNGKVLDSLKDLDKRELWNVTEIMHQWCVEAEVNMGDMIPEYNDVQRRE